MILVSNNHMHIQTNSNRLFLYPHSFFSDRDHTKQQEARTSQSSTINYQKKYYKFLLLLLPIASTT